MKDSSGLCEMCGHHVTIRQKAHILAEGNKAEPNLLMLCPTCHVNFDVYLKPKIFKALVEVGGVELPSSWAKSIYDQAAEESQKALKQYHKNR